MTATALAALALVAALAAAFALGRHRRPPAQVPRMEACDIGAMLVSGLRAAPDLLAFGATGGDTPVVMFNIGGGMAVYGVEEGGTVGVPVKAFHPDGGPVWDATLRVLATGVPETLLSDADTPCGGRRHYLSTLTRVPCPATHGADALAVFSVDVTALVEKAERSRSTLDAIGRHALAVLATAPDA